VLSAIEPVALGGEAQAFERMRDAGGDGLEQRGLGLVERLVMQPRNTDDAVRGRGSNGARTSALAPTERRLGPSKTCGTSMLLSRTPRAGRRSASSGWSP
jgi:hypothetical protein